MGRRATHEDESEDLPEALEILIILLREKSMRFKQTFTGLLCGLGLSSFAQVSQFQDLSYFVGMGSDTIGVVIDFLDSTQQSAYAWGVLFDDSINGQGVVDALSQDQGLSFTVTNGFLNDVIYSTRNLSGIGGNPHYWGTWSGSPSGWTSNLGLATQVSAGSWFGFSYIDFNPPIQPGPALPALNPLSIGEEEELRAHLYPVPFRNQLAIELSKEAYISIYNIRGQVMSEISNQKSILLNAAAWPNGQYSIVIRLANGTQRVYKVVKLH